MRITKKKEEYVDKDGNVVVMIILHGKVQGVSCRFTTNKLAVLAGLSGYVQNNEMKNEVEIVFKGKEDDIKTVIEQLIKEVKVYDMDIERLPISYWLSNGVHYIDYGKYQESYNPNPVVYKYDEYDNHKYSDLGLYGDDFAGYGGYNSRDDYYNHNYKGLTQEEIDYINGRGE